MYRAPQFKNTAVRRRLGLNLGLNLGHFAPCSAAKYIGISAMLEREA